MSPTEAEKKARLVRAIQVGKRQLGMEDMAYRALILRITGGVHQSSTACTTHQLSQILNQMRRMGFRPSVKRKPK